MIATTPRNDAFKPSLKPRSFNRKMSGFFFRSRREIFAMMEIPRRRVSHRDTAQMAPNISQDSPRTGGNFS